MKTEHNKAAEQSTKHIILIGFMGAGKTTVSRKIARWQHLCCIDIDRYIENQHAMRISKMFIKYGEKYFRDQETAFLRTLANRDRSVISTGGGIVLSDLNRQLLKESGTIVYLQVTANDVAARIKNKRSRPLLTNEDQTRDLLDKRRALYEQIADITINTSDVKAALVAQTIITTLQDRGEL
ncbi:MAG: shikimate kinase [Coriobacteriales bacterium]|jgi:shikimate kinase|nr:shikimate kinase [Coriobacteriales bacterium]